MSALSDLFDHSADYAPQQPLEALLQSVPAKGVVYLLADEADRPVQLLCVRNLRASLKRRLGEQEEAGPTRRVDYRQLVRRVYWKRVESLFEADGVYLEIARALFPQSYRGMVGFEAAWFVQVDPGERFPRYVKTIDPRRQGTVIGPFADKHAAARWIQLVEDAFDLCRYYNVLLEAPRGRACAYKEMGKCPAPCDGSLSMEQYRELIAWSAETAVAPQQFILEQTQRMNDAAAELRFESAGKIRQFVEQLGQFGKGAFRYARCLEEFKFVSLQQGPRPGTAKVYLIRGGEVKEVAGLLSEPRASAELLGTILREGQGEGGLDERGVERMGVVADHLFRSKRRSGVYLRLAEVEEKALCKAYRELQKQEGPEESEEEGVVKELQQM